MYKQLEYTKYWFSGFTLEDYKIFPLSFNAILIFMSSFPYLPNKAEIITPVTYFL